MCGRYTYKLTWEDIVALYRLTLPDEPPEGLRESFNVAPTHLMPIIRPAGNGREGCRRAHAQTPAAFQAVPKLAQGQPNTG